MKTIHVVQCFDGFDSEKGWVPTHSCATAKEAAQWIVEEKVKNRKYEVRGLHYRTHACKFVNR